MLITDTVPKRDTKADWSAKDGIDKMPARHFRRPTYFNIILSDRLASLNEFIHKIINKATKQRRTVGG